MIDDRLKTLGIVVSIVAGILAAVHMISDIVIDNTIVLLLLIGAFPWLIPYIKDLKVTGLGEIEFKQAIEDVKTRVASIDSKVDEAAETVAATQSMVISGVGKSPASDDMKGEASTLVEDHASSFNNDPNKGKFGGRSEQDGYQLIGVVRELKANSDLFEVILCVNGTGSNTLAEGKKVKFYLHPTFRPAIVSVTVKDRKATLKRYSWGAFTVGAIILESKTNLELDLAQLPDVPAIFKSR